MSGGESYQLRVFEGDDARRANELAALCLRVFDDFDASYLTDRLPHVAKPLLVAALSGQEWTGFKFGYARGNGFYSWLGGIIPEARRQGLAGKLMDLQHSEIKSRGYQTVSTRTRATNTAMIVLNLRSGFEVTGFEIDAQGHPVVTQTKRL